MAGTSARHHKTEFMNSKFFDIVMKVIISAAFVAYITGLIVAGLNFKIH